MRSLIYLVASSLDGFIADTGRGDPSGTVFELDGDHTAALLAEYPEIVPFHVRSFVGIHDDVRPRHVDTVLEGRGSYEIGLAAGVPDAYPHLRHLVFSTTLEAPPGSAVEIVRGDAVDRVRELKREDGLDLWLCGGGSLAATLREEIDEIHLKLNPVVLGDGVPLFARPADGGVQIDRFRLRESRVYESGVVLLVYERRG